MSDGRQESGADRELKSAAEFGPGPDSDSGGGRDSAAKAKAKAGAARRLAWPPHKFRDAKLERLALTHRSMGVPNNERLEWLGDSLLNAAVSEILWRHFPELPEGTLSETRMMLVCNETLAEAARRAGFGPRVRLGRAELSSKSRRGARDVGRNKKSVLASALEAYVAAVRLDGGDAMALTEALLDKEIRAARGALRSGESDVFKPAKTRLQELVQADGRALPEYLSWEFTSARNRPYFRVDCRVAGEVFRGFGSSIRGAGEQAAKRALDILTGESGEDEGKRGKEGKGGKGKPRG